MSIKPNETLITGSWALVNGRMTEDPELQRIRCLIANELEQIAISPDGWHKLYRDPRDGRYWEKFLPYGGMQGGGPESLRVLDLGSVREKYGVSIDR